MSVNGLILNKYIFVTFIFLLFSTVSLADCSPPEDSEWTISENEKIICSSSYKLYGFGWKTENITIDGTLILNNSGLRFKSDLNANIKIRGNLTLINDSSINATHPSINENGNITINSSEKASFEIRDSDINDIISLNINKSSAQFRNTTIKSNIDYNSHITIINTSKTNITENSIINFTFFDISNSEMLNIKNSSITTKNIQINKSNNVLFEEIKLENLSDSSFLNITGTTMEIDDIKFKGFNINLKNSTNITFIDTNATSVNIDENSSLFQAWTIKYFISDDKDMLLSGVEVLSNSSKGNLTYEGVSDNDGKIEIPFKSYYKNNTGIRYYSNYTSNFSKENYKNVIDEINITKMKTKYIEMKSIKGMVKTGAECTSSPYFCADKNDVKPSECENMHAGDECEVIFTVNATDNIAYNEENMVNDSFIFFSIIEPHNYSLYPVESNTINITIII
ncbi:MAG: hypothetical protein ACQER9_04225 [Nanobdellota archaeon]